MLALLSTDVNHDITMCCTISDASGVVVYLEPRGGWAVLSFVKARKNGTLHPPESS